MRVKVSTVSSSPPSPQMKEPFIGSWVTLTSGVGLVVVVGEKLLLQPGIKPRSSSHFTNCLDHLIFAKFAWKYKFKYTNTSLEGQRTNELGRTLSWFIICLSQYLLLALLQTFFSKQCNCIKMLYKQKRPKWLNTETALWFHLTTIYISGVVSVANTTRVLELSDRYVFWHTCCPYIDFSSHEMWFLQNVIISFQICCTGVQDSVLGQRWVILMVSYS